MKSVVHRRTCIILALSLPGVLIMLNAAYGQRGGRGGPGPVIIRPNPQPPRPVFVPPPRPPVFVPGPPRQIWITVWSCSNCRAELGRGNGAPPAINTCPSCGANLVSHVPVQAQVEEPVQADADNPMGVGVAQKADSGLGVWLATAIGTAVLLMGGAVILIICLTRRRPALDLKNFERLAITEFEPLLTRHGFALEGAKLDKFSCEITYGNGERYVWISANAHWQEKRPYFNVFLGEGDRDFAARNASAVALWEIKNLQERDFSAREYILRNSQSMRQALERAHDDLATYEGGFLSGRTEKFHEARKLLTHEKDCRDVPYAEAIRG